MRIKKSAPYSDSSRSMGITDCRRWLFWVRSKSILCMKHQTAMGVC